MIKVHQVEKDVKRICQESFNLEKLDIKRAEVKLIEYLNRIKKDFHHIEYDILENHVKLLLYTSQDDGFDLSFKMTKVEKS